ncbi:MAG: DUF1080 domain-containing protein [Chthonomonadales bacterium]
MTSLLNTLLLLAAQQIPMSDLTKDVGAKPPKDAIVLFDGKSTDLWQHGADKPVKWTLENGELTVAPGTGNIVTKAVYKSFHLHLEFATADMPDKMSQSKSNSGVKLHTVYEIQILDSVNNPTHVAGMCASIYTQRDPDKNVCRKPGEWQAYDIDFTAPTFTPDGNTDKKPRVTVYWNGELVHKNVEIPGPTNQKPSDKPLLKEGAILLQDHGAKVKFKNIWIVPAKE